MFAHAGIFSTIVSVFQESESNGSVEFAYNAQTIPLLKAAVHIDPNPSKGGGDIIIDADALVPEGSPTISKDVVRNPDGEISVYIVREGDSLSQIAEMFAVSPSTILWANDIKDADLIQPGDTLVILPISGVRHIVKDGDTLKAIAKKYNGDVDDILAYNGIASADGLTPGETIVVPGGEVAAPKRSTTGSGSVRSTGSEASASALGFAHPVPGARRTQGIHGYNGVDLAAPTGTAVRAAAAGEVIIARASGWNGGYGKYIVIKHANGTQTLYAHNSANYVAAGQRVSQGETIGAVGSTGRSTGTHLHFEVRGARNPF